MEVWISNFRVLCKRGQYWIFCKGIASCKCEKGRGKSDYITAIMLDCEKKCVRWHLYDIKDILAGEDTAVKLYNQWNSGVAYLQQNILALLQGYSEAADLGVITRCYDKNRMEHLLSKYQGLCNEMKNGQEGRTLSQRKRRPEIAKYKGKLKAIQAILDSEFQSDSGTVTYKFISDRWIMKKIRYIE